MKALQNNLLTWYQENSRVLPWRASNDPYKIWISEVMLQQTTVKAVIPYFEKFVVRFPTVAHLAKASLEDVYEYWAGLGYYSRARNLHRSSQFLAKNNFPKSFTQLLELPGFGPYTARAVSSIAFGENVGVLDGNVIRFLCRFYGLKISWWEPKNRPELQSLADRWVQGADSSQINQALMEIGATICTPLSPACFLCPVQKSCKALKTKQVDRLPLKKPRKQKEIWIWNAEIFKKAKRIAYVENNYAPFLKGKLIFPGVTKKLNKPPKVYDFKHNITHHEIYVKLKPSSTAKKGQKLQWYSNLEIKKIHPVTLLQKALLKTLSGS